VFRWHGDSQTRTVFNHAMLRLCSIPNLASKGYFEDQCVVPPAVDGGVDGCRLRTACYAREEHGVTMTEHNLHEADVWVSNFGQWCAGNWEFGGHLTAARYGHNVRRYFLAVGDVVVNVTADTDPTASMWTSAVGSGYIGVIASAMRHMARALVSGDGAGRDKHVMWMETPPFPLRADNLVAKNSDWRTPHRVRLFNAVVRRWWAEGVRQLRQFAAVVQRRGSGTNVTDSPVSADVGVVTDAGAATSSTSLQADIAVNIDVAGRATTQRVLVSYIPTMSRYTAIIGAAEDQAHLKHPEALDSSSNAIFAAVTRCAPHGQK
jgi:hypothetical protein